MFNKQHKVYLHPANEDWIVDRFVKEWYSDNIEITVLDPHHADVVWLLASWAWKNLPNIRILHEKKVLTTVHHIVPEKFNQQALNDFMLRDSVTDAYHVYNEHTLGFIKKFTKKPIHLIEYWANQKIWNLSGDKKEFRRKYQLPLDGYLIGSFQRDTEGKDLITPKLEKGPDLFCDAIESWWKENKNLHVVLAGWRRQYIISRLTSKGIPFTYFEKPHQQILNELYQTLDLYPITSRCEGGPQALIECGLLKIPVVSRNVGIASQVLPLESISDNVCLAVPNIPNVEKHKLPYGYNKYKEVLSML